MITTVCLNPSFDKTVSVDEIVLGDVNRLSDSRIDLGGKGFNVAIVAKRLGMEAQCLGIAGQNNMELFQALIDREEISAVLTPINGDIRTNLKVLSRAAGRVTEFNELGAKVAESDFKLFCETLRLRVKNSAFLVLTGSLPPGLQQDTYAVLMRENASVPCILDAAGDSLLSPLSARPFLVKPNVNELASALKMALKAIPDIRRAALMLIERGAQNVLVSMGEAGAMITNGKKTLYAHALSMPVKSTVGAGDAMVGGMLYGLEIEGDTFAAFKYAVAAGTAAVMTEGTQLIRLEDFKNLLQKVNVQEV